MRACFIVNATITPVDILDYKWLSIKTVSMGCNCFPNSLTREGDNEIDRPGRLGCSFSVLPRLPLVHCGCGKNVKCSFQSALSLKCLQC